MLFQIFKLTFSKDTSKMHHLVTNGDQTKTNKRQAKQKTKKQKGVPNRQALGAFRSQRPLTYKLVT